MIFILIITLIFAVAAVQASPLLALRRDIIGLTTPQIDEFNSYTHYASAAYCTPSTTLLWTCGVNCANNSDFKPVASGGDGNGIQYWYVGYDPNLDTVIVAHQGTNISNILAILTDLNLVLEGINPTLFPGLPSDIQVHSGFQHEQSLTALDILSSVETTMSKYLTTSVTLVGHSLGAALSLLDSIYLPLHLPSGTTFRTIVYGLPRVGNQAFANYVDDHLTLTHINNLKDPIPILPPIFFGYVHPAGEVHIRETGEWAECPGQDNSNTGCIVGDVPTIFNSNGTNHIGPYNGIEIHCLD